MKCQSKISVSFSADGAIEDLLIKGKIYECEPTPKIYDPITFDAVLSYIVRCEDGKLRKYDAIHFIDLQDAREQKLNQLGI